MKRRSVSHSPKPTGTSQTASKKRHAASSSSGGGEGTADNLRSPDGSIDALQRWREGQPPAAPVREKATTMPKAVVSLYTLGAPIASPCAGPCPTPAAHISVAGCD